MAEELYPGASYASPFLTAQALSPLAQLPGQVAQSWQRAREQARADEQLDLRRQLLALREEKYREEQRLKGEERKRGAEQHADAVDPLGLPRAGSTGKAARTSDGFAFDPSLAPTSEDVFGGYANAQAENRAALALAGEQAAATGQYDETSGIVRGILGLEPGEAIPRGGLLDEFWGTQSVMGAPEARPGFYEDADGREVRAITPRQKKEARRQAEEDAAERDRAMWANKYLMDVLGRPLERPEGAVRPGAVVTTDRSREHLEGLGLLKPGEEVTDITSIEEMLANPATRVGLDPAYSRSPEHFAGLIRTTEFGEGLAGEEKARLIQDYEKFHKDRTGERRAALVEEQARQQAEHLEALEAKIERKIGARVALLRKQPDYRRDSPEQLRELAWASLQDDADFKAMQSDITEIRKTMLGEGPDWKKRELEKRAQEREFKTEDMRTQARYDDLVGGFINEYKDAFAHASIIPTNQDGTYKSAEQLKGEIGDAITRLKGAKLVKTNESARVSEEATRKLMNFHERATRAQDDAEARREEKIPEAKEPVSDEITDPEFLRATSLLRQMENDAIDRALKQAAVPADLRRRRQVLEDAITLTRNQNELKRHNTRLDEVNAEIEENYPGASLKDIKALDYMSPDQADRYTGLEDWLVTGGRGPMPAAAPTPVTTPAPTPTPTSVTKKTSLNIGEARLSPPAPSPAPRPGPGYEFIKNPEDGREYWWNRTTNERVPLGG